MVVLNQQLGTRLGLVAPLLYSFGAQGGLNDVIEGTVGTNAAAPGWDPCTGLGTPRAAELLRLLKV